MNAQHSANPESLDRRCINTIRALAVDTVQKANSGHPGAPMGLAAAAYVLWTRVMRHNPADTQWPDRDRFVLSGGHASTLLYCLLHLTGYDLSLEDLQDFRQWGSKTPGHPEYGLTPGVETTTGPLGQGFANAVGLAMAERHLAARFNRDGFPLVDHRTYVMCGDGDLMEGVCAEAASLAGHLHLDRLICLYDDNKITIEGGTDLSFTEDVACRFEAYGWRVLKVANGNDPIAIEAALATARQESGQPTLIVLRTHIAHGSPNKQDTAGAHGAPLGVEEVRLTKENLGCPPDEDFCVPDVTREVFRGVLGAGRAAQTSWDELLAQYAQHHPQLAREWQMGFNNSLPDGWGDELKDLFADGAPIATRAASGKVLNAIAAKVPFLMGGSADLAPSNNTLIKAETDFQADAYHGRNIRFGVREHAMAAILAGMTLHRGLRVYGGTFFVFSDYMRPAIRLASLMQLPVIYVLTHDSVAVGEDGPTHQPVEHLASLRAMPGLTVIRPADAHETTEAWRLAMQNGDGPVALVLSRQKLPLLPTGPAGPSPALVNGAYLLSDSDGTPDIIIMASGAEVHLAIAAGKRLTHQGRAVRVVSMPSWELFENTDPAYQSHILPPKVTARLAIEAGVAMGWERYVGCRGSVISIEKFGASAPGGVILERYGFRVDNVVSKALELLAG